MAASQLLVILAYHYAKPAVIAPFNYSVVVFSGLIGWLVWGTTPGWLGGGRRRAGQRSAACSARSRPAPMPGAIWGGSATGTCRS